MVKAVGPRKELGTRYNCFSCGTKFYDLHRPLPTCPKCEADQRDNPELHTRPAAASVRRPPPRKRPSTPIEPEEIATADAPATEEDDEEFGPTDLDEEEFDEEDIA